MPKTDFKIMRDAMIDSQLRTSGVNEPWVMAAMGQLPRENFVPEGKAIISYMDRAIELTDGRVINPPVTTGMMLEQSEPNDSDAALLIGAGSGYVAHLLANRVKTLVALEENEALLAQASNSLTGKKNVRAVSGSHNLGQKDYGPYTLIWIEGAIEELPDCLVDQLAEGGRIIAGQSEGPVSRLVMGIKRGGAVSLRAFADGDITPLPGFAKHKEFAF